MLKQVIIKALPDFIARPSGVWDTRAPFHEYFHQHRQKSRVYFATVLSLERLRAETRKAKPDASGRAFFRAKTGSIVARNAWLSFKKSWDLTGEGVRPHPTMKQVSPALAEATIAATEHALVSYSAMFETYVQCWALNYLLAKLESAQRWDQDEKTLAAQLSPLRGTDQLPGLPDIGRMIPVIRSELGKLPHIAVHPETGKDVIVPLSPSLNALRAIQFWRDYRNLLVHSSGLVSLAFYERQHEFADEVRLTFPYLPPIELGKRLVLTDATFRAATSTHYVAAKALNELLLNVSGGRRGHALAPASPTLSTEGPLARRAKPMLMPCDHTLSLQWIEDEPFRDGLLKMAVKAKSR